MSRLTVPDAGLVVLVGIAGCGKSTFAQRWFADTEILASDDFRAMVTDDPADQSATPTAFSLLGRVLDARLRNGRLSVVDATNLSHRARRRLVGQAEQHDLPAAAIVFDLPLELCRQRNTDRVERRVGEDVLERQHRELDESRDKLTGEGFRTIHLLRSAEDVAAAAVAREGGPQAGPRPALVVDVDGTVAPVEPVVRMLRGLERVFDVVLVTGRPADFEDEVRRWLARHGVPHVALFMRPAGDRRPDVAVKRQLYDDHIAGCWDVTVAFEDREPVADMWRERGLYVLTATDPGLDPLPAP